MATGTLETSLTSVATLLASDFVRAVKGGVSRRISITNLGGALDTTLKDQGFITVDSIPSTTFNQYPIKEVATATYTVTTDDAILLFNISSASCIATLPPAADAYDAENDRGQTFTLKIAVAGGSNTVSIVPDGSESIDGVSFWLLQGPNKEYVILVSDGANWHVVGNQ